MPDDFSYYALLGVEITATTEEIKKAYRRVIRTHHPDAGGDPHKFIEINRAYNVLVDPETRSRYDSGGDAAIEMEEDFEEAIIVSMSDLFESVISMLSETGVDIGNAGFMDKIREIISDEVRDTEENIGKANMRLSMYNRLRVRIVRSGEERNIFAEIVDSKIKTSIDEIKGCSKRLRLLRRCQDEASYYTDVGEFVRTVQAARYPGAPWSGDGEAKIFGISPTMC